MSSSNLLWVHCEGGSDMDRGRLSKIRRHVMLDYLAKPTTAARPSLKKRSNGSRSKRGQPRAAKQMDECGPSEPFTNSNDQEYCHALQRHLETSFTSQDTIQLNWIVNRLRDMNRQIWRATQEDEAMREIFILAAASQEARITGTDVPETSLQRKVNAIRLVSKQVSNEGNELNSAALILIALLAKDAFNDSEFGVADAHLQGIATLIGDRVHELPWLVWNFVAWEDLAVASILERLPRVPFFLPPEFSGSLPSTAHLSAHQSAVRNVRLMPLNECLTEDVAIELFGRLHEVAYVFQTSDLDWKLATKVGYEACWMSAILNYHHTEQDKISMEQRPSPTAMFLLGVRILINGSLSDFTQSVEPQRIFQKRMMNLLQLYDAEELCDYWQQHAALESLLWVLFNTSVSAVAYPAADPSVAFGRKHWLRDTFKVTIRRLESIKSPGYSWIHALCDFPSILTWTERWFQPFVDWVETGFSPEKTDVYDGPPKFGNHWQIFSPPSEIDPQIQSSPELTNLSLD